MGNLSCPIKTCPLWKKGGVKTPLTEQARIHRFPAKNAKSKEAWEAFVSEANGTPFRSTKYHGLCSAHFIGKYVMPSGRISRDAIPTIAPLSTKKVLCKWDISYSQLFPVTSVNTDEKTEVQHGVETQEKVVNHLQVQNQAKPVFLQPEDLEMAPLLELGSQDIQNLDNCDGILNRGIDIDVVVSASEQEGIDPFLTPEQLNFLNVNTSNIPQWPKSLNTARDIETAIEREKKLALLRYKSSMRRIRGLELLLRRTKNMSNKEGVSQEVTSSPVHESSTRLFNNSSKSSLILPKHNKLNTPSISRIVVIGDGEDSVLPPPLLDDCS